VMFRWQSRQSLSSTLLTNSMLLFGRCRCTLGFHRTNVKPLSVNTRPFMNGSGGQFAPTRSRLLSWHGAAPREMISASAELADTCRRHGETSAGSQDPVVAAVYHEFRSSDISRGIRDEEGD
jgi:hypothetical protein